jgi:signal transduction histidine kinase
MAVRFDSALRVDSALAALLATAGITGLLTEPLVPATGVTRPADTGGIVLVLLMTLPLALRRRYPIAVVAVTTAAVLVAGSLGYGTGLASLGILLAVATAAYCTDRTVTIRMGVVIAALLVLTLLLTIPSEARLSLSFIVGNFAALGLALLTGDLLREARETSALLARRNAELGELRDAEAREAVAQDRVRIAREVHDTVGHALAGIALQARAAERRLERDPPAAAEALAQIDELASSALHEARHALGLIRGEGEGAVLAPQPTLDQLPDLVGALHADEVRVELHADGIDAARVPAVVQAAAYRIVQESLSNVVKHAARPATAVVSVRLDGDALAIEVRDDGAAANGTGAGGPSAGHGLRGMRERAKLCDGTLQAGPAHEGGWVVTARLPLNSRAEREIA